MTTLLLACILIYGDTVQTKLAVILYKCILKYQLTSLKFCTTLIGMCFTTFLYGSDHAECTRMPIHPSICLVGERAGWQTGRQAGRQASLQNSDLLQIHSYAKQKHLGYNFNCKSLSPIRSSSYLVMNTYLIHQAMQENICETNHYSQLNVTFRITL